MTSALACSGGQDRCIIGQFVKYETTDASNGDTPSGDDLGTSIIKLIK